MPRKKSAKSTRTDGFPIEETLNKAANLSKPKKILAKKSALRNGNKLKKSDFIPTLNKKQYLEIINEVIDPEIGVGVADMGLIYDITEFPNGLVEVEMTLTSMGCPAGGQITSDIEANLKLQSHVKEVKINMVWDPPWNPDMMNPDIRTMLLGNGSFTPFGL